jgi:FKBP-type peptidyl-prolyl cis-trans isomerase
MRRVAAALLCLALVGCGDGRSSDKLSSRPSTSPGECAASGTGTTDLATKPAVATPTAPEPTATTTVDIVCGTGELAKEGSKVEVKYVGLFYKDGQEFDSSWSRGSEETLPVTVGTGVIPGFSKGITGMKVGGRREVIIPAEDGYGAQGSPPAIPANATLIFVIDLVTIQKPAPRTPCTPSGSGTTDLTKKPTVTVPTVPAPAETTVADIVCGTGAQADDGSAVEVKYLGVLYKDGKEFDSSWSRGPTETLPFTVGSGVIPGFSKGVTGMKVGGRRMIIIPAKDGYGDQASGPIPAGSTLIFVIDLVKVT